MRNNYLLLLIIVFISSCGIQVEENKKFEPYHPPIDIEKADEKAQELLNELSLDEKLEIINGYKGFYIKGNEKFGFPDLYMADATQGVHLRESFRGEKLGEQLEKSTAFPCPLSLAATWNVNLAYDYAKSIGEECRAGGIAVLLGPGMNMYRISQCGRNFEYFGEDPFLAGRMIENYVVGLQNTGTIATLKHFVCNNSDFYRRRNNVIVDERTLHEIYTRAFKAGIDAGAMAVMTSYNLVNDEWCGESNNIINDLLRDKLRFKWLVMTDWWSVYDGEKVVKSGQDLEMPRAVALEDVKTLLKNKKVTEDEIDRMAKSVLRTCIAMNFYDKSIKQPEFLDKYPEHVNVALQSAREGIVLLKNNGILPVDKNKSGNILLTGKYINNIARGGGAAKVEGYDTIILSDALTKEFGGNITYLENPDIDQIKEADIVLLTIGTYDSEGWDRPFALPEEEENKIIEVLDNNENTIVIVISGSGIQMTNWKDKAAAILYAWYGGQAGNVALVEILSGKTNPSGKLPITIEKRFEDSPGYGYLPEGEKLYKDWAKNEKEHPIWDLEYKEGIFIGYRWYEEKNIEPLFPFGYGLSYTTFKYSNLKVSHKEFFIKDTIQVSFIIKNTGKVKGKEIAQLYINDPESTHPRPVKELKEFIKVDLLPGEAKKVILYLDKNDFSYWNPDMKNWFAERGVFNILIGSSLNEIKLSAEIILE